MWEIGVGRTFLWLGVWRIERDSVIQSMISSAASAWSIAHSIASPIFDRSGVSERKRSSRWSRCLLMKRETLRWDKPSFFRSYRWLNRPRLVLLLELVTGACTSFLSLLSWSVSLFTFSNTSSGMPDVNCWGWGGSQRLPPLNNRKPSVRQLVTLSP